MMPLAPSSGRSLTAPRYGGRRLTLWAAEIAPKLGFEIPQFFHAPLFTVLLSYVAY